MVLAILEQCHVINPIPSLTGESVSAGYQNFIICIEMLLAAIALWFAFPYKIYISGAATNPGTSISNGVSLQSISSNLRETINPKDIMADAIHNFHPDYQDYAQQVMWLIPVSEFLMFTSCNFNFTVRIIALY
jgi:hypothetical protein